MEKVASANSFLPMPRVPQRAEPQTLHPGTEDDQPSSSLRPAPATPTSPSPCPLSRLLLQQQPRTPGSAVKSKVKALSEHKKAAFKAGMAKKACPVPSSLFSPSLVSWGSSSSDDDAESQGYTFRPVVPDSLIEEAGMAGSDISLLALPRSLGEGSSLENLSDVSANASPLEDNVSAANMAKPWVPPKGFWKATRPETLLLTEDKPPAPDRPSIRAPGGQQRKAKGHSRVCRELLRRDSLEGLRRCMGVLGSQGATVGLWRADSLESVCSNGSSISLAERVEMNRGLLKQMLNKSQGPEPGAKEQKAEEVAICNGRGTALTCTSPPPPTPSACVCVCVCVTVCEANRAFVSSEDLPLSQRHEQAKRLLESTRMKARSYPLKADHTILPMQRDNPEQLSTAGAPFHRAPLAGKGSVSVSSAIVAAVTSLSGNLSDSSSSDSACGPRRRPGQSPTRVRFEDESEKDAEVRYLERLRQRRRAQGLLISKPNLSSYVNGRRDTDPGRCLEGSFLWHKKACRTQDGYVNGGSGGHFKAVAAQEALNRQCNSCGTFLEGGVPNLNLHLNPSPPKGQNGPVNEEGEGKVLMSCSVAPSEPSQTVLTELIKETYIGKVTLRDVADSDGTGRGSAGETDSSRGGGSVRVSTMKVKRRSRRGEILGTNGHGAPITVPPTPPPLRSNHSLAPVSSTNGIVVVPPNPYAIEKPVSMVVGLHTHSPAPPEEPTNSPLCLKGTHFPPSPLPIKSALKTGPKSRPNGQRSVKLMSSPQYRLLSQDSLEDQGRGAAPSPQNEHSVGGNFKEDGLSLGLTSSTGTIMPCIRPVSLLKTSPSPAKKAEEKSVHPAPQAPEVELHHPLMGELCLGGASIITPPPYYSGGGGRVRGPMRAEHQREDSPRTETEQQEGRSKLSLLRLFAAIGLNGVRKLGKGRSSSMEQLSFQPRGVPPAFPGPSSTTPTPSSSSSPSPARPEPSQLRKALSLQSLRMGSPFKQLRKSSSVQNLQSWGLQRVLSVENVGYPSGVRSVGRVAQAFPDGTLLLELSRSPNGPFGFHISRGKGRPDSGVYVEEMDDSSTEKMYAGLLGVGDELLEVNGEKVAGLSLDMVTRLMTQENIASVRVLRHRRLPPRR
ncbi:unnamed protein product [Coregonus sp. 'balchen']|nr:unnamed protein product [Coregonus sp. 'balchen']